LLLNVSLMLLSLIELCFSLRVCFFESKYIFFRSIGVDGRRYLPAYDVWVDEDTDNCFASESDETIIGIFKKNKVLPYNGRYFDEHFQVWIENINGRPVVYFESETDENPSGDFDDQGLPNPNFGRTGEWHEWMAEIEAKWNGTYDPPNRVFYHHHKVWIDKETLCYYDSATSETALGVLQKGKLVPCVGVVRVRDENR
jgi:hypothetical protein